MRVHIVTSAVTYQYYEYCVANHRALAAKPERLDFVAYCLDQDSYQRVLSSGGKAVLLPPGNSGSIAHMLGIKAALANMEAGEVNIIADSDSLVLLRGWDVKLEEIVAEDVDVIGTIYEDIGGFSSGTGVSQTYKRVPNFTWCALTTRHAWDFDVSADKGNLLPITTKEQSEAFNLPIGFSLFREPCWKFPLYLYENSIKYYSLEFVRPNSGKAKAVLTGEDYHTEYTLSDGTPFVAHQRGSMSKQFRVHPLSKTFYDACDAYIASQLRSTQ